MLKLMDLLTEGVQDKGIFKAVFMAGGPGSGKSYIKGQLFGIPEGGANVSVSGLKSVNSDREFMFLLKKYGFDPTMLATYEKHHPDLFKHLTEILCLRTTQRPYGGSEVSTLLFLYTHYK